MRKLLIFPACLLALATAAALRWLLSDVPLPQTPAGWIVSILLAVPAILIAEALGDLLLSRNPVARAVERRTRDKELSWLRTACGVTAMLLAIAVVTATLPFA
jgi:hypothetical protein